MNTNTAAAIIETTPATPAPEVITFGGLKMTRAEAVATMHAAGWDQARIDAWGARNAPTAPDTCHVTPAPETVTEAPDTCHAETVTPADAPAPAQETVTPAPAEQMAAPTPEREPAPTAPTMPAAWQARADALAAKTVTPAATDAPAPRMASGMWFWMDLYGDRPRVTIAEPTGETRGILTGRGAGQYVPVFHALDEDGGRHEVCEHDIGRPGIGGLTPCAPRPDSTPDDWRALRETGERARAKAKAEREQTEAEREARRVALPAQYPTLKTVTATGKSGPVTASANIKRELRDAFPGVKFSVRCEHYTSIDISWSDGPTSEQVEAITGKYEKGSFDGMTDSYNYDHYNVFPDVFGGAQYVFCRRSETLAGVRRAWELAGNDPAEVKTDDARGWFDRDASNRGAPRDERGDGPGDRMFQTWAQTDLYKTVTGETVTPAGETVTGAPDNHNTEEHNTKTETAPEQAQGVKTMNEQALSASLADAVESIANMPVVDPALGLTFGQVVNAYHEALKIARDALAFYARATGETVTESAAPVCPVDDNACDGCAGVRAPCDDATTAPVEPEAPAPMKDTSEHADEPRATHTPGPWMIDVWDYPRATPPRKDLIIMTDKIKLAKVECAYDENPYTVPQTEAEANARLIAAAPELLDALTDLVGGCGKEGDLLDPRAMEKALAAIAKATGNA